MKTMRTDNRVLHEITPLGEHDFMYVADRHKKEFTYPMHSHEIFELNFVENAAGCRRVIGDSSEVAGMTPSAFSRFFKLRTGRNLNEYVVDVRLGHAARRLVDTTDSVAEICYCCGFNTLSNFNRLFRKRKGFSPTEFREKYCKTRVIV